MVEWKIKITDVEARMVEQETVVKEQQEELDRRAKQIADLKTTVRACVFVRTFVRVFFFWVVCFDCVSVSVSVSVCVRA